MKQLFKSLKPQTRKWIKKILDRYQLESHHERLLVLLGQAWERSQEAEETLKKEGAYVYDRFEQRKAHPAVSVARDSMATFARLLRELALDIEQPAEESRPPAIYE